MEIGSLKEAWQKYRKRVAVAVFIQTMSTLTGVGVIGALNQLPCSLSLLNLTFHRLLSINYLQSARNHGPKESLTHGDCRDHRGDHEHCLNPASRSARKEENATARNRVVGIGFNLFGS